LFILLDAVGRATFIFATAVMSWRVGKEERQLEIVEYILIGTFARFIVAVAFGLAGRGLLGLPLINTVALFRSGISGLLGIGRLVARSTTAPASVTTLDRSA
jgi:hypothetical protein